MIKTRRLIRSCALSLASSEQLLLEGLLAQIRSRSSSNALARGRIVCPEHCGGIRSELFHPLSEHFVLENGASQCPPSLGKRVMEELVALRIWRSCTPPESIGISELARLNQILVAGSRQRTGIAMLSRNGSAAIQLPEINSAVVNLSSILATESPATQLGHFLKAVHEYVAINNSHIFVDGNGRTARVLLNFRLQQIFGTTHFIAFKKFFIGARGAHELCLREAEIFDRWLPLSSLIIKITLVTLEAAPEAHVESEH